MRTLPGGPGKILIVDDEPAMRSALRRALRRFHCPLVAAGDGTEAFALLQQHPAGAFSVAVVDLRMPGMDGIELLGRIKQRSPETQVLLLTGRGTISDAVRAMRLGADDFLEKPFDPDALCERVRTAQQVWAAKRGLARPDCPLGRRGALQALVGESAEMVRIRRLACRMSNTDVTLLVQGESGTGKEQFARAVHYGGCRAAEPFVVVDTAAMSATVIESELFGHAKGAFTGAEAPREGLLRAAGRGTVLLDEIGHLPLPMQSRLLRVLQEREVRPVGSDETFPVYARFIAASNKDLAAAVARGEFREDLYHRLNVISVTMPPLRERKEDIAILAQHFLIKYADQRPTVRGFSSEAIAALIAYDWPGNVRELENAILRALILGSSDRIQLADLPVQIAEPDVRPEAERFDPGLSSRCPSGASAGRVGTLAACEKQAIASALEAANGNRTEAAKILGIGVATLYRKMKRYGLR